MNGFGREANASSQIKHENIAAVLDGGTTPDGDFFFVMEFVGGKDLSALIKEHGPMTPERAVALADQLAQALEAAHKTNIIHRDLKPSNIMVSQRGEQDFAKILDFGIAKFLDIDRDNDSGDLASLTRTNVAIGTPKYMAPEQIGCATALDARADIYALGGILYYVLTGGRLPHEAASVDLILRHKLISPPHPSPSICPA